MDGMDGFQSSGFQSIPDCFGLCLSQFLLFEPGSEEWSKLLTCAGFGEVCFPIPGICFERQPLLVGSLMQLPLRPSLYDPDAA